MSEEEKIDFITSALNTHPDQAKNIYTDMYKSPSKDGFIKVSCAYKIRYHIKRPADANKAKGSRAKAQKKKAFQVRAKTKAPFLWDR